MGCRSADRWRIFVIPSGVEESLISKRGFLDLAWTKMVRDVSTSLDMTKGSTERGSDILHRRFSAPLVIPSEVEESLIFQRMIVRYISVRAGVAYFLTQPRSSSFGSSTSLDMTKVESRAIKFVFASRHF